MIDGAKLEDDDRRVREAYADANLKVNEYLFRRVDIEDVVCAHLLAADHAPTIGFDRYLISATTPFLPSDLPELRAAAPLVVRRRVPEFKAEYARRRWTMVPSIDRVYVNSRPRNELGWQPKYDFKVIMGRLEAGQDFRSPLAQLVGSKGYHVERFANGPYPVELDASSLVGHGETSLTIEGGWRQDSLVFLTLRASA